MHTNRSLSLIVFGILGLVGSSGLNANAQSDPNAVALATKSYLALTGGHPVQDAAITGSALWTAGSDQMQGQFILKVKGTGESRVDLNLGGSTRSEIRNDSPGAPGGVWIDANGRHATAVHNSWTDPAWFFPASFAAYAGNDPSRIFSLVGTEMKDGIAVIHLRTALRKKMHSVNASQLTEQLSTTDLYLDPNTLLPMAMAFNTHPDNNANIAIPLEIRFSDYKSESGVLVPHHIQKYLNFGLVLDLEVENVSINPGLSDTDFSLQ